MTKLIIEKKEVEVNYTTESIKNYLDKKVSKDQIITKSVKEFPLDPLTVAITIVGVGGYIWYKLTKEQLVEFKKALNLN